VYNSQPVFEFLAQSQQQKLRTVIVSVAGVIGPSARRAGAQLIVDETGRYAGSISGGCVEAAAVSEALQLLRDGGPREIRFGRGSPFIDLRLPCGGGMDLLFNEVFDDQLGERLMREITARRSFSLAMPRAQETIQLSLGADRFGVANNSEFCTVNHIPRLRLAVLGQGTAVEKLRDLALACPADVIVGSPDAALTGGAGAFVHLKSPTADFALALDKWTATVFLFHDHDWELPALLRILGGPGFYIGAMGSRATHSARRSMLEDAGVPACVADLISCPIGLIPSMRDPELLAISILAEVMQRYDNLFLSEPEQA
jgi:xanthine dehydrogenase accessory factor